jgi:hypothetical protein
MNPRFGCANRCKFGNTNGKLDSETPNHRANVAAISSVETFGIQLPRLPVSSGPLIANVGIAP